MDSRIETYKHIHEVQRIMESVICSLIHRQRVHDDSKLRTPEVEVFDEFTPKLAGSTYGSDEYKEFLVKMGVGLAHHYEMNSHHPEHFADGIRGMNLLDLIEMLCDWYAATLRHKDGCIWRSIEHNQKRFGYSDELKRIFEHTAEALGAKR